jgi:hypothetical protein
LPPYGYPSKSKWNVLKNWTGSLHHNIPSAYMYSCLCPMESQASLHGMHSLTAREYECRVFFWLSITVDDDKKLKQEELIVTKDHA